MSALRLLVGGIGSLFCITTLYLLVFVNGLITSALTPFIFGGTYKIAFGINMIPVIQAMIMFMAVVGLLLSIYLVWQEVFSEVTYYPEV